MPKKEPFRRRTYTHALCTKRCQNEGAAHGQASRAVRGALLKGATVVSRNFTAFAGTALPLYRIVLQLVLSHQGF